MQEKGLLTFILYSTSKDKQYKNKVTNFINSV